MQTTELPRTSSGRPALSPPGTVAAEAKQRGYTRTWPPTPDSARMPSEISATPAIIVAVFVLEPTETAIRDDGPGVSAVIILSARTWTLAT